MYIYLSCESFHQIRKYVDPAIIGGLGVESVHYRYSVYSPSQYRLPITVHGQILRKLLASSLGLENIKHSSS